MMVPGQEQLSPAAGPRIELTPSVCRHSNPRLSSGLTTFSLLAKRSSGWFYQPYCWHTC